MSYVKPSKKGERGMGGLKGSGNAQRNTVYDDTVRAYVIKITEGNKTRDEQFVGTVWQLKEREMNFYESKGLDYQRYMRQTRYTFMPVEDWRMHEYQGKWKDFKAELREIYTNDDEYKAALKAYNERREEFLKRYKKR